MNNVNYAAERLKVENQIARVILKLKTQIKLWIKYIIYATTASILVHQFNIYASAPRLRKGKSERT
jgi:hypothetical protein